MHFSTVTQGAFVLGPPGHDFMYLDEEQLTQSWAGKRVVPADGFVEMCERLSCKWLRCRPPDNQSLILNS